MMGRFKNLICQIAKLAHSAAQRLGMGAEQSQEAGLPASPSPEKGSAPQLEAEQEAGMLGDFNLVRLF